MSAVRFATMADADHAVGVVALVNSLHGLGHTERVTVLDLGLTAAQRAELAPWCDFVAAPERPRHPWLLVPAACLAAAPGAAVVVYLDSDIIVTAPLDEIIAEARAGRLCAFVDVLADRWFPDWADRFALDAPLRRQPYVNAGFVALSTSLHETLLRRWGERCAELPDDAIRIDAFCLDDPCGLPDQDVLNAMLMSEVPPGQLAILPASEIAQGRDQLVATRVVDRDTLACRRGGTRCVLLHAFGAPKPWQSAARRDLPRTAYLVLLRQLLSGPDLAVRTQEPLVQWLRPGWRGTVAFHAATTSDAVRTRTRGVRQRLGIVSRSSAARRRSRASGS